MTAVRVKNKTLAETEMLAAAKITLVDAVNQAGSGDCDADTFIEPVVWRAGSGPTNAGLIPLTIGAPTTDPWGTSYGYCVWDIGPTFDDAACGGPGALRLNGSDTPLAGHADTQTVMAIVSAGPDRQFQTSCINYVDATTSVVTKGGDDLVLKYTYAEAGSISDGLWGLKLGDPDTAKTAKDVEIGDYVQIDNASGQLWAGGGVELGDESLVTICDGTNVGLMRYNTAASAVEVCDGVDWVALEGGGGGPTNGLVGYWKLDDGAGATAVDSSANSLDGTISGATWTTGGIIDGAITFDGTNDYIEVADDALLDVTNVTVSAWVYKTVANQAGWGAIASRQAGVAGDNTFWLGFDNSASDLYACFINTANGFQGATGTASTGDATTWVHVSCTYDGSNIRIYRNGTQIATAAHTGDMTAEANRMLIGADNEDANFSPSDYLNATVDDVRLYDRALSVDEISTLGSVISQLDDLADVYTDYGSSANMIIGRTGAAALAAGAAGNTFIGEGAGATSANSTALTDNNTGLGYLALRSNTTGFSNVATGSTALMSNTIGTSNVAVGRAALQSNTTGNSNVAIGTSALATNLTGSGNIAIGTSTLFSNSGINNTAVGMSALFSNTTGTSNVATGMNALLSNTTASSNTAIGVSTLASNTTGGFNTAVGFQALMANTTVIGNTAVGSNALQSNTTGASNTALGMEALRANTTGFSNTAVGSGALDVNTTGITNTAMGTNALGANTTGGANTATGFQALMTNTTGTNNTAMGVSALRINTTGADNTAIGQEALQFNTTAANNTAVGSSALWANSTGTGNTAIGRQALYQNSTGGSNTAVGYQALLANTTGASNTAVGSGALDVNTTASNNTAMGLNALGANTTGGANTAVGGGALMTNTAGTGNVAVGHSALQLNATGINNTAIGSGAGLLTTGSGNILIGAAALAPAAGTSNHLNIGNTIYADMANDLVGIQTPSPAATLHVKKSTTDAYAETLIVEGDGEPAMSLRAASATATLNPILYSTRSRGTIAAPTIVSSGDSLLELQVQGYDGSAYRDAAYIKVLVDGTPGASDMPGRIEFHTQADGGGAWLEGTTPEMVIDSAGDVGLGTSTPSTRLTLAGNTEEGMAMWVSTSASANHNPFISTYRSRGTVAVPAIVGSNDNLGELLFYAYDGSDYRNAALIEVRVDGTPGTNDMPARMEFHVQADGFGTWMGDGASPAEMVIKNNGAIGIGTETPDQGKVEVKGGSVCVDTNSDDNASSCITTESDERLKKNIKPIANALEKVLKIRGVEFDWRSDEFDIASKWKNRPHGIGVIAQEVEKVFPEAMGEEDQGFKTVEYRYLVAPLIEAVRELRDQNKALADQNKVLADRLSRLEDLLARTDSVIP